MQFQDAKWTSADETDIEVTVDSDVMIVAKQVGNIHYDELVRQGITIEPYTAPEAEPRRTGTFIEFMMLFEPSEQVSIKQASLNPANAEMGLWYDQAVSSNAIDLDAEKTATGIEVLVLMNLITTARRDEILSADFDAIES